jgi:glycosyltransferase involved in cell wall biosynthesis
VNQPNSARPGLSVVICTHNPDTAVLDRSLDHLRGQTLAADRWEFVLVDNASEPPLRTDLSRLPQARLVREDELGLTPARLRGIRETRAPLILFVDDDNLLDPDFLETIVSLAEELPHVGAFGGRVVPAFQVEPPTWIGGHLYQLAIQDPKEDIWCRSLFQNPSLPCGAGLCVRRTVAEAYVNQVRSDPRRQSLDRKGQSLLSAGDTDLALTACDIGLATGIFTRPRLQHLIPGRRLSEAYLVDLHRMQEASGVLLRALRNGGRDPRPLPYPGWKGKLRRLVRRNLMSRRDRAFDRAGEAGRELGNKLLEEMNRRSAD